MGPALRAAFYVFASVLLLGWIFARPAHADSYTTIQPPPVPEFPLVAIMNLIYGGTFVPLGVTGVNFTNGTVQTIRVWDGDVVDDTLDLLTGDPLAAVDQIWTDGVAMVTAEAKFAAQGESFGWNGGGRSGTGYIELLTHFDVGGPAVEVDITGDMLWGMTPSSGDTAWSRDSENLDGLDHLVTYKVLGLDEPEAVWLLFWEDLSESIADFDYNDFVVEVRAVPEPGAGLLSAIALGVLAAIRLARS